MWKRGGNVRKKIKIFKSGKYRQGEYDKERVKNIFSNAKVLIISLAFIPFNAI